MPFRFQRSIEIQAPPEPIYEELINIQAPQDWTEVARVQAETDGPVQIGTQWTSWGKTAGLAMRDECQVTVLEPPHKFRFSVNSHAWGGRWAVLDIGYSVTPKGEGSEVTFSGSITVRQGTGLWRAFRYVPGMDRFLLPVVYRFLTRKVIDRGLVALRGKMEGK